MNLSLEIIEAFVSKCDTEEAGTRNRSGQMYRKIFTRFRPEKNCSDVHLLTAMAMYILRTI